MDGKPYREGTSLEEIVKDGWSRGFSINQTVSEAKLMGYRLSLAECRAKWQEFDAEYESPTVDKCNGINRCGRFIASDEYCELYAGHEKPCGMLPQHEHWFDRNGYCKTCGKDGGPEVYGETGSAPSGEKDHG